MINSQKYTKLLITKNQKKISNPNSTISKKTTKTRKKAQFLFPGRYRDPKKTHSKPNHKEKYRILILHSSLYPKKIKTKKKSKKKNEFPFPDNKSTKRNTHNKRNRKEKYQNLILTKT